LHRLDIADKHREMLAARRLPVVDVSQPLRGFVVEPRDENGTNLISVRVPFGIHGPMNVDPEVAVNITIAEVDLGQSGHTLLGKATDLPLETTLADIDSAVRRAIGTLSRFCDQ
jgi:hypothetical protein